jgi:hypothetical protein
MLCAINLANTGSTSIPTNFVCTLSTNPMWNGLNIFIYINTLNLFLFIIVFLHYLTDMSTFTDNQTFIQELLSRALQFL